MRLMTLLPTSKSPNSSGVSNKRIGYFPRIFKYYMEFHHRKNINLNSEFGPLSIKIWLNWFHVNSEWHKNSQISQIGIHSENCRNSLSHLFRKNFVKAMVLLKKLLNSWFDEIFFQWERISRFSTLCIKDFFREINSLDDFFVKLTLNNFFNKSVDFTEFLVKKVRLRMSQNIIFSSLFWKNHTNYVRKNQMQQRIVQIEVRFSQKSFLLQIKIMTFHKSEGLQVLHY